MFLKSRKDVLRRIIPVRRGPCTSNCGTVYSYVQVRVGLLHILSWRTPGRPHSSAALQGLGLRQRAYPSDRERLHVARCAHDTDWLCHWQRRAYPGVPAVAARQAVVVQLLQRRPADISGAHEYTLLLPSTAGSLCTACTRMLLDAVPRRCCDVAAIGG